MSNHTPGPWKVVSTSTAGYGLAIVADDEVACEIASVYTDDTTPQQAAADAALIAAAPELYDALDGILNGMVGARGLTSPCVPSQERIQTALAVLKKARGQEA